MLHLVTRNLVNFKRTQDGIGVFSRVIAWDCITVSLFAGLPEPLVRDWRCQSHASSIYTNKVSLRRDCKATLIEGEEL